MSKSKTESKTETVMNETAINVVAQGTRIEGKVVFNEISRVHGILVGDVFAQDGSTLILGETSIVEGNIQADTLMVDGYVQGDIAAKSKVIISRTGRVVGNIQTQNLQLEFGAYFEGKCSMGTEAQT
jgi:cytoskeletal protein CcmA (bactofilin family)